MNMRENDKLIEVANDVRWLRESMNKVVEHFETLTKQVYDNKEKAGKNRTHINIQWWVITVVIIALSGRVAGLY